MLAVECGGEELPLMKILSLNCQKDYQPALGGFLRATLAAGAYDFLLLQEADDAVLAHMQDCRGYKVLTATDERLGKQSMLCIVYRETFALIAHEIQSFAGMRFDPVAGYKHLGFGILSARYVCDGTEYCVGSTHLHAGIHAKVRIQELPYVKEQMVRMSANAPAVFGGDFNFGYPWELPRAIRFFTPEFYCLTRRLGGTLDSRYSEYCDHLPNKIAHALARLGLSVKLRTDHFFVSRTLAVSADISCRVLPDRVSDHSPVEFSFN